MLMFLLACLVAILTGMLMGGITACIYVKLGGE